jgi:hypothetical protein
VPSAPFVGAALRPRVARVLVVAPCAWPVSAGSSSYTERMLAKAVNSCRKGRFYGTYGHIIDPANAGHPASARYATLMYKRVCHCSAGIGAARPVKLSNRRARQVLHCLQLPSATPFSRLTLKGIGGAEPAGHCAHAGCNQIDANLELNESGRDQRHLCCLELTLTLGPTSGCSWPDPEFQPSNWAPAFAAKPPNTSTRPVPGMAGKRQINAGGSSR